MTPALLAPALLAVLAGSLGGWLRRRLPPRVAVLLLTVVAAAAAMAVVWGLLLIVVGGVLGVPEILARLEWCERVLQAGHAAPAGVAIAAAVALAVGAIRGIVFEFRWHRSLESRTNAKGVEILDLAEPVAFSVPALGTIIVSRGLLDVLAPAEQTAMFAHERCHLDRGHHRYLRVAGLAAAVVPILSGLAAHVRFATEREADEAAAQAVGDRLTVARAIVAAAIGEPIGGAALAMGDHAVTQRVEELLHPPSTAWLATATVIAAIGANVVVLSSSTLQFHHLVVFGAHVCGLA